MTRTFKLSNITMKIKACTVECIFSIIVAIGVFYTFGWLLCLVSPCA